MKCTLTILASMLIAVALFAAPAGKKKTLKGHLIDIACATDRKDEYSTLGTVHTRRCLEMPACVRSGYGVLTRDMRVYKFDEAGNEQAKKLIDASDQNNNFQIQVSGRLLNDTLTVSKIELLP